PRDSYREFQSSVGYSSFRQNSGGYCLIHQTRPRDSWPFDGEAHRGDHHWSCVPGSRRIALCHFSWIAGGLRLLFLRSSPQKKDELARQDQLHSSAQAGNESGGRCENRIPSRSESSAIASASRLA